MKRIIYLLIIIIFSLFITGCNKGVLHKHIFENDYVAATCTKYGYLKYRCSCGKIKDEQILKPLGHKYGEWYIKKDSTVDMYGIKEKMCERCYNIISEEMPLREYPDLQGYIIKIAQSELSLPDLDPFLDNYYAKDKEAKQKAWREVEELFNCKIEVHSYPLSAEWGPSRWNYIITSAQNNSSVYDFCYVPCNKIPHFVNEEILINLEDYYVLYGNNIMYDCAIAASTYKNGLYSLCLDKRIIERVLVYNLELLKELQSIDPTLEEPAKIFNEKNWTYNKFVQYCEQAQTAMCKLYGEVGKANSLKQEYYVVAGWDVYWWLGLVAYDSEPIIDGFTYQINLNTEYKRRAAETLKYLYNEGFADPMQMISSGVSWNNGKALFNAMDIIDVLRYDDRYGYEDVTLGYVPWPRADNITFEDIKIGLGNGTNGFVMPIGRDYSGYGKYCNPENIYWAFVEMYNRTNKYYSTDYLDDTLRYQTFTESEESEKAFLYMIRLLQQEKTYYDLFEDSLYHFTSFFKDSDDRTTIKGVINQYCATNQINTWEEAIANYLPKLTYDLLKEYG